MEIPKVEVTKNISSIGKIPSVQNHSRRNVILIILVIIIVVGGTVAFFLMKKKEQTQEQRQAEAIKKNLEYLQTLAGTKEVDPKLVTPLLEDLAKMSPEPVYKTPEDKAKAETKIQDNLDALAKMSQPQ